jgi:beta-glucosidase
LLEDILRREWGFDGYVVSDCWAIIDIYRHHRVVETPAEAAALAVKAGCDLNCGVTFPALREAVELGLIDESTIDRAVGRLFNARFRLGMFDPPEQVPFAQIPYAINDSAPHRELALRAARESIVLLKNDGELLPLNKDLGSIAVIGPNADDLCALLGNYNGTPARAITPLEGIREKVSSATAVYHARGCAMAEGMPPLSIVPAACLLPREPDAGQRGVTATFWDNASFEGDPALTRIDPVIDFMWKGVSPLSGEMGDPFSVRWEGHLIPPVSGTYQLGGCGFNKFDLALDGDSLVSYESVHHARIKTAQVELEAGRLYDLRFECASWGMDPQAQMLWSVPGVDLLTPALEAAEKAEVVVLVMGFNSNLEGEEMAVDIPGFRGGDRTDILLPAPQEELVQRIHGLGKPVVLVLLNGSAIAVNWADEHVPAIVEAWYPGQAGGAAIADVLFGDYNPAGRLPVTFYRSVDDLPDFSDYRMEGRTYRYFRGEPLYPFGYGLSYTRFTYQELELSADRIAKEQSLIVSAVVKNTGARAGDEVVQLYVSPAGDVGVAGAGRTPIRSLKGFARVHLAPGESQRVTFVLAPEQIALIDDDGRAVVLPGAYRVSIGGRQPRPGDPDQAAGQVLFGTFEITP